MWASQPRWSWKLSYFWSHRAWHKKLTWILTLFHEFQGHSVLLGKLCYWQVLMFPELFQLINNFCSRSPVLEPGWGNTKSIGRIGRSLMYEYWNQWSGGGLDNTTKYIPASHYHQSYRSDTLDCYCLNTLLVCWQGNLSIVKWLLQ
jgi:hypothetical protein